MDTLHFRTSSQPNTRFQRTCGWRVKFGFAVIIANTRGWIHRTEGVVIRAIEITTKRLALTCNARESTAFFARATRLSILTNLGQVRKVARIIRKQWRKIWTFDGSVIAVTKAAEFSGIFARALDGMRVVWESITSSLVIGANKMRVNAATVTKGRFCFRACFWTKHIVVGAIPVSVEAPTGGNWAAFLTATELTVVAVDAIAEVTRLKKHWL
jgi:hypothetical protein